ncbi:hypothetical protein B0T22DRAFT_17811 [Podospora appendiculata]|uniref:Secreted protein n=1 Tax=Podospora appendiculata TaxID=314037 RepID=A0AAE1CFP2_9PEZI|nr:hypothetical protein B0T22DRAFT_17811 [Podospora appendiculata]
MTSSSMQPTLFFFLLSVCDLFSHTLTALTPPFRPSCSLNWRESSPTQWGYGWGTKVQVGKVLDLPGTVVKRQERPRGCTPPACPPDQIRSWISDRRHPPACRAPSLASRFLAGKKLPW